MNDQPMLVEVLTPADLANVLRCSVPMVYKLVEKGEIGSVRVGRSLRFTTEQVATYLAAHEVPAVKS